MLYLITHAMETIDLSLAKSVAGIPGWCLGIVRGGPGEGLAVQEVRCCWSV
jgi:hypothetical protein